MKISEKKIEVLLNLLSLYKIDDIIYPGLLIRKLNLKMNEVYIILETIESLNIIERNFEVYCSTGKKSTGAIYRTIRDIPSDLLCEECGKEIDPMEDTIIVYRMLVK
ncbi:hypothetical protein [Bacillus mycoides]|uniref:hypothetical protein n=1 Tax=Bacillus mycoides TaxID=1405 RepID=UPI001C02CFE2|nr:hypothetical protein [Bacillus mycoides]